MTGALQVSTTVATREDARRLAALLVDRRLAACVQVVGPIESTYRWQGAVRTEQEWLLIAKTTEERYPDLETTLAAEHPYDVPEFLAAPVVLGSPSYLEWLTSETSP